MAELREPGAALVNEPLRGLAERGIVRLPAAPKRPLPKSPVRLSRGTSRQILDELD